MLVKPAFDWSLGVYAYMIIMMIIYRFPFNLEFHIMSNGALHRRIYNIDKILFV